MENAEGIKSQIIAYAICGEKLSDREIARRVNCSQAYVSKVLKRTGIERNVRIDWESFDDIIFDMLNNKATLTQIANEIGVEYCTLRSHCIVKGWQYKHITYIKPTKGKIELGAEVFDEYTNKTFYDYTDCFIDRPCVCQIPEWKKQLLSGEKITIEPDEEDAYEFSE